MAERDEEFPWETNDDFWVAGRLTGGLLRKIQGAGLEPELPSPVPAFEPCESGFRPVPRRSGCEVRLTHQGRPCLCAQYDPTLVVPVSLFDPLELSRDLLSTAWQYLEKDRDVLSPECEGLVPMVLERPLDSTLSKDVCLVSFRFKKERVTEILERFGHWHAKAGAAYLHSLEFQANSAILPKLVQWCEGYRSLKVVLAAERARAEAEAAADAIKYREALPEKAAVHGWTVKLAPLPRPESPGTVARRTSAAMAQSLKKAQLLCMCGHAEVWHAIFRNERPRPPSASSRSGSANAPVSTASSQGTGLPPRSIQKSSSAVMVGGRLVLKDAAAAMLQVTAMKPASAP